MILNKYRKSGTFSPLVTTDLYFLSLLMRLVKEIPHAHYLVQVHEYNGKYLLKITLDQFEQTYKFPISELPSLDLLEAKLTPEFWSACLKRFLTMRDDYITILQ